MTGSPAHDASTSARALPKVTVTLDVEDLRPDHSLPERVVEMTNRLSLIHI